MINPDITQKQKRETLENDRKVMSSYLDHARASADDLAGGRFAKHNPTTVTGTAPIAYPKQPENSPWACDPLPAEPRLGFSVETIDPVGETWEQEASKPSGDAAALEASRPKSRLRRL